MRERTFWQDHVLSETGKFLVRPSTGDGSDVYFITPYGTVMQKGTYQDATHFNSIEEGLSATELAAYLANISARQALWKAEEVKMELHTVKHSMARRHTVEFGTVTLENTLTFPFNNSKKTVSLATKCDDTNYIVSTEIKKSTGNVGEIIVSEKLVNGFKIEYTGSAPSVTVSYFTVGGFVG